MTYYIPDNIDIDSLMSKLPKGRRWKRKHLILILHLISEIPLTNRTAHTNGYTHLNTKALQQQVRNYKPILSLLLSEGILERDKFYVPGTKSYGYRFTSPYRYNLVAVQRETSEDRAVKNQTSECEHLTKWFNGNLKIDKKLAGQELFFQSLNDKQSGVPISALALQISKFANQDFYFHRDSFGNRLHTSLFFKKCFRSFLSYNDCKLVSTDIVCSQPFMSLLLFTKDFYLNLNSPFSLCNLSPEDFQELSSKSSKSTNSTIPFSPYMVGVLEKLMVKEDVLRYKELVINGLLYEEISKHFQSGNREASKTTMFSVMYSSNRFYNHDRALPKRIFRNLFPSVYEIFSLFKTERKNGLVKVLQKIESELILNTVTCRIAQEKPDLCMFTVHDSVATTIGNEKYVDQVLKEECEKVFGFQPKTKIEPWTSEYKLSDEIGKLDEQSLLGLQHLRSAIFEE